MKKKVRDITERVPKKFLLDLLEPFHPTIKQNEKIVDVDFAYLKADLKEVNIIYRVEGGVTNS